jgi:ADP-heptose:LPS heptosyltransferase
VPEDVTTFVEHMRSARYDLILQMQGSGAHINKFLTTLGAKATAGFVLKGEYCADSELFMEYPTHLNEVQRHVALIEFLTGGTVSCDLEWIVTSEDLEELRSLCNDLSARRYVCLHPGARYLSRRWPAERFAEVGRRLAEEGLAIVITGSAEERALGEELGTRLGVPHLLLSGRTTLGGMFAVAAGARLIVTNDTGMSHVAAAVKTPSVVIVTGSDPKRWAPLDRARHRVVSTIVECQPCEHRVCPYGHECAQDLPADEVIGAALAQLNRFLSSDHLNAQEDLVCADCES